MSRFALCWLCLGLFYDNDHSSCAVKNIHILYLRLEMFVHKKINGDVGSPDDSVILLLFFLNTVIVFINNLN